MEYSPKDISEEEFEKLIGSFTTIKHRILFMCCYYFALRPSEAVRINEADFIKANILLIPEQKNGFKNETYFVSPDFLPSILAYRLLFAKEIKANNGFLFFNGNGGHIALSTYYNIFFYARKKAGLDTGTVYRESIDGKKWRRISPHTAKAKRIKQITNKLGEREAQALAHHKSRLSTLRYSGNPMNDFEFKKKAILEMSNEQGKA